MFSVLTLLESYTGAKVDDFMSDPPIVEHYKVYLEFQKMTQEAAPSASAVAKTAHVILSEEGFLCVSLSHAQCDTHTRTHAHSTSPPFILTNKINHCLQNLGNSCRGFVAACRVGNHMRTLIGSDSGHHEGGVSLVYQSVSVVQS
jgi:hypothetical protein